MDSSSEVGPTLRGENFLGDETFRQAARLILFEFACIFLRYIFAKLGVFVKVSGRLILDEQLKRAKKQS